MSLLRAPILKDIAFITAVTEAEYNAEIESTKNTKPRPHGRAMVCLLREFWQNESRYNGTAL